MTQQWLDHIIQEFAKHEEVDAILLAGSHTNGTQDPTSDYDLYIYTTAELPVERRAPIILPLASYAELDNRYWETEDDFIAKDGTPVEIIYRSAAWLDGHLHDLLVNHAASVGYTTCFWSNLLSSRILFDRNGSLAALQAKYRIPYPAELKRNIIAKNHPLLRAKMPAYSHQIEKALKRQDLVSVNHRVAALLASYFDILFAVNELPHPGEKKLVRFATERCVKLPQHFAHDLEAVLTTQNEALLSHIATLIDHLDELLAAD